MKNNSVFLVEIDCGILPTNRATEYMATIATKIKETFVDIPNVKFIFAKKGVLTFTPLIQATGDIELQKVTSNNLASWWEVIGKSKYRAR